MEIFLFRQSLENDHVVRFYFTNANPKVGFIISKICPAKIDRAHYIYPISLEVSSEVARIM